MNGGNDIALFDTRMMGLARFCGVYVLRAGDRAVLIDAGTRDCSGELIAFLRARDTRPGYLIITHNHHDHIGAIPALRGEFPDLDIFAGPEGKRRLENPNEVNRLFSDLAFEPVEGVTAVADGELLDLGGLRLRVLATPGHSDDSISVYDPEAGTLFPGDLPGDWLWGTTYLSPHLTPDFSEVKMRASVARLMALDIRCSALSHYGCFTGADARGIYARQLERYEHWKRTLLPCWEARHETADLVPALRTLLAGSPFLAGPDPDGLMGTLAQWCVMGYRASGLI